MPGYSMTTRVAGAYDEVRARVVEALKAEGFGVITTIDMQQTIRDKLGETVERYEVLGACNPQLAFRALELERSLGLLLPCNVAVRELGGEVEVSILDPEAMFDLADSATQRALATLPHEVKHRLEHVLTALKGEVA